MSGMSSTTDHERTESAAGLLLESALEQCREACHLYNEAVGSYNTHLDDHRDRRDLRDVPFREPVTAHEAFEDALDGDPEAIDALIASLIDEAHLDSRLRRHPHASPIHLEATEQLQIARDRLVCRLEEALVHVDEFGDPPGR